MPLTLRWAAATPLPIDADGLRPDLLAGLTAAEVARRPILAGNAPAEVGDLFRVAGDPADGHLILEGDLRRLRRLGAGMGSGTLTVRGDAGPGLGAGMAGGTVEVSGSVGDGAFAAMNGGLARIRGSAGDGLGGALPGAWVGMREGVILVEGPVGADAGLAMRRGLIAVAGPAGPGFGRGLIAGSLFAFGPVAPHPGAGMKRGTLAFFDESAPPELLPTFRYACRYRPPVATIYLRGLAAWGFPVPPRAFAGTFGRYNGDLIEDGQGEVWAWAPEG